MLAVRVLGKEMEKMRPLLSRSSNVVWKTGIDSELQDSKIGASPGIWIKQSEQRHFYLEGVLVGTKSKERI